MTKNIKRDLLRGDLAKKWCRVHTQHPTSCALFNNSAVMFP